MLESLFDRVAGLNYWILTALFSFFRNHTPNNQLIRINVTYLVKKHLNVRSIYYNVSFLVKSFWNLSSLLHNLTYLSPLNSFLLLVLSTFPVFLKSLNDCFFRCLACKSLFPEFWCNNKLHHVVFQSFFFFASSCFPRFSWVRFFRVQGFLGFSPGCGSRF